MREEKATTGLDPREIAVSWALAVATLERINGWAVLALRLGTLALLQECVHAMAQPHAKPELVQRAKELVDALGQLPWSL